MERAAWNPGWLDRDQSIAVGLTDEFVFWRVAPDHRGEPEVLVFYNRGWDNTEDMVVGRGTITAIRHPELGEIREVDTNGSNYRIYLADGTTVDVDQEQKPGYVADAWAYDASGAPQPRPRPNVDPRQWRMVVELDSLSDLQRVDSQRLQLFFARRRGQRRMTLAELSRRHGVALADAVGAATSLGLSAAEAQPLAPEDVYLVEMLLGLDRG